MTTQEKCEAIIRKMVDLANEDKPVTISEDWKCKNACTIAVGDSHTHVGWRDATFEQMIDGMYNTLIEEKGLSFVSGKE